MCHMPALQKNCVNCLVLEDVGRMFFVTMIPSSTIPIEDIDIFGNMMITCK